MLGIRLRDKKRASWIREQPKVDGILMMVKNKKWTGARHIIRRCDNTWTTRVTELQPSNGVRIQGSQRVRWRDEN